MPSAYAAPASLEGVIELVANSPGSRLLAGGQSLLVEPNRSRVADCLLVDLRRIPQLAEIQRQQDGGVEIGAMTTMSVLTGSKLIRESFLVLAEAAHITGD